MGLSDRTLGGAILFAAMSVFVYYTCWAVLLPFFDADSPVHGIFPSREWAVRIPAFLLVLGMSGTGIFMGSQIIKDNFRVTQIQRSA